MPSYGSRLSAAQLDDLVAYLTTLRGARDRTQVAPLQRASRGTRALDAAIALLAQDGQWRTYPGRYASHRYSPLDPDLRRTTSPGCGRPGSISRRAPGRSKTTPLFANGIMYMMSGPTMVAALDLQSGKPLWEWTAADCASVLNLGFPRVNRGVAILENIVYVGTLDGYRSRSMRAGVERWSVHVGDNPTGHAITAAPLVVEGKVIVGIGGGEADNRGFLDAYDAKTGKQAWRFYPIPIPASRAPKAGPATVGARRRRHVVHRHVRSPTEAALLGHRQSGDGLQRRRAQRGQPLHVVARGHRPRHRGNRDGNFQFTPHDVHDWDANQIPGSGANTQGLADGRARWW